jgi:P4 family phage/plasmid primase-like protien
MSLRDVEVLGLRLYNAGFNVIPVNSEKSPFCSWNSEKRIEEGEFKKLLSKAQGIGIAAGPIHPFGEKYDLLIVDIDKPSVLKKTPYFEHKLNQTVLWMTGPRCPKCEAKKIDKEIEVLELGKRFKCKKCSLEFTLDNAKRGLAALFLIERGSLTEGTSRGGVEIKRRNYQLIPPSIHPSGVYYSWINPIDFTKKNFGIAYLDPQDLRVILSECLEAELNPEVEVKEELKVQVPKEEEREEAEEELQIPKTQVSITLPKKCPFCKKYHTINCPAENEDSVKTGIFFQNEKAEPVMEECFEPKDLTDEKGRIDFYVLAHMIISENPIVTDIRTYLMYRWNGKVWVDDAEGYIHKRLVEIAKEKYRPHHKTRLLQIVQGLTFTEGFQEPPKNLICFENGVLDIETMELKPHDPKLFFRNMIHAKYNPNAKAEKFMNFINEIFPDEESRLLAQEIFGYCLYRGYPFHVIFFFVGEGRNGKDTFIKTIQDIIGRENCSGIDLDRLGDRFQDTELYGKLVNFSAEPKTKTLTTEPVKRASGESPISAEIKGKQKQFLFINYAKLICSANRLPTVRDTTIAWWDRIVILNFPVYIPPEKRIPNIEDQWLKDEEERSGIVNWALEGLRRLLQNKRFTTSKMMEEMKEEYMRWSNPIDYFISKKCILDPKEWIKKSELYDAYKEFCEEEGLPIESEENFGKTIRMKPKVKSEHKKIQGKKVRVWVGIGLKSEEEEEEGEGESELQKYLTTPQTKN